MDADPELAEELDDADTAHARQHLVLPRVSIKAGPWSPRALAQTHGVSGEVRGFLVLSGAVTIDLAIAQQICTRLITPNELVLLDGIESGSIPVNASWAALQPSSLALFDDRLRIIGRRWPGVMTAILNRAAQQVGHALLQQAISQLPRVEDRLLALMWSIADRQGVVRADGVHFQLPVGHQTLAQMIGARRPTVSLGLKKLAVNGWLSHHGSEWILSPDSLSTLAGSRGASSVGR